MHTKSLDLITQKQFREFRVISSHFDADWAQAFSFLFVLLFVFFNNFIKRREIKLIYIWPLVVFYE